MKHVLVVAIDGWGSSWIGPYGNTMVETPALNRLAAEGLLFDYALIDAPQLETLYQSFWSGRHTLAQSHDSAEPHQASPEKQKQEYAPHENWIRAVREAGQHTLLLTDCEQVAGHPLAAEFGEQQLLSVEPLSNEADRSARAETLDETYLARYFEQVIQILSEMAAPESRTAKAKSKNEASNSGGMLVWCHCRGMTAPWDAPYELRMAHVDEEDPDPPTFVDPPQREVAGPLDPDERFGLQVAYAAQIEILDTCLGGLLASLGSLEPFTTVVVMGTRGYPLGEHGGVGLRDPELYGELLSIPLLVRLPKSMELENGGIRAAEYVPVRSPALIQPHHVGQAVAEGCLGPDALRHAMLEDTALGDAWQPPSFRRELTIADQRYPLGWAEAREEAEEEAIPQQPSATAQRIASLPIPPLAVAVAAGQKAVRTPAWFARFPDDKPAELYTKPDDRFEVNEVADRGVEELEQLRTALDTFQKSMATPGTSPAPHPLVSPLLLRPH